jgi:hypothetical protein
MVDNNYNEIKIIDKYKTTNTFTNNSNNFLRQINEPSKFEPKNSINDIYFYQIKNIDKENKILEKIFMIYELHDDFDKFNINILLNLLSNTSFEIHSNSMFYCNVNINDAYFFCDYNGDDIIYINQEELNYKISIGEFNPNENKYCDMFRYLLEKNKYSNKLLIIPICTYILINYFPLMLFRTNVDLIYKSTTNKIFEFIKNIYCSTQTININQNVKFGYLSLYCLNSSNYTNKISKGVDLYSQSFKKSLFCFTQYIIITLKPDYEEIDSNLLCDVCDLLPKINSVIYNHSSNIFEKYNIEEIALIKKSPNSNIYCLPSNSSYSIKTLIKFSDNDDVLNVIKTLHTINNDKIDYFTKKESFKQTKFNTSIQLTIETPKIPIIINFTEYFIDIITPFSMKNETVKMS